jgi:hypothetical protein
MSAHDGDELKRSFEERLREWNGRAPRIPGSIARTRVAGRLPEHSRPMAWARLLAAAAMVVLLIVAVWRGSPRPAGEAGPSAMASFVPSLDENVVVWVIDSRTTVYFVLDRHVPDERGVS